MTALKTKTLRRMLKKAGLKVSGKKATLRARAKKAHLVRGGQSPNTEFTGSAEGPMPVSGGGDSYPSGGPGVVGESYMLASGGSRGLKAKTLKKMLKKAGLKVSGKKSTLKARAKSAHLIRGGMYHTV